MKNDIINGILLGDGNLQTFTNPPQSYRLRLVSKSKEYIEHLYSIFKSWTGTGIKRNPKTGVYYFNTLTRPELMSFGQDFYSTGSKALPSSSRMEEILTPEAIAYWYMDDGSIKEKKSKEKKSKEKKSKEKKSKEKKSKGLRICTDSFSLSEVNLLCSILKKKYNIESHSYLNRAPDQYRIHINAKSYYIFKEIVSPYIISYFQYKLPFK